MWALCLDSTGKPPSFQKGVVYKVKHLKGQFNYLFVEQDSCESTTNGWMPHMFVVVDTLEQAGMASILYIKEPND